MSSEAIATKPTELADELGLELSAKDPLPIFIWGAPGVGKSSIVYQVAQKLGYEVRTLIAGTCDPVDLRGAMALEGKYSVWRPPKFFQVEDNAKVLFFFDELNTATPAVQAAFYRIILEGRLDNIDISNCPRLGAGNRATDMAVVNRMPTTLVGRFYHYTLLPNFDDWKLWAYQNGISEKIISFLNFRTELLLQMPKDRDNPFPSPRTYEYLSRKMSRGREMTTARIAGAIGEGAAVEFNGFLSIYKDLPKSAEEVLSRGIKFDEPSRQYAVNGILTNHFRNNPKKDVADELMKYSYDIPAEFAVCLIKDSIAVNKSVLVTAKGFIEWSKKFKDVII